MRRYDDLVDVRAVVGVDGGATPDAFVWRGRLYVVRAVLARWHERRAWWRDSAASALLGLRADDVAAVPGGAAEISSRDIGAVRSTPVAAECQVWRVEAAAGRASPLKPKPVNNARAMEGLKLSQRVAVLRTDAKLLP